MTKQRLLLVFFLILAVIACGCSRKEESANKKDSEQNISNLEQINTQHNKDENEEKNGNSDTKKNNDNKDSISSNNNGETNEDASADNSEHNSAYLKNSLSEKECEALYKDGNRYYANGEREKAIEAFSQIRGYKDSAELADSIQREVSYELAVKKYEDGYYDDSYDLFKDLGGYKDSDHYMNLLIEAFNTQAYFDAMQLYENEQYDEAGKAFESLIPFSDSEKMAKACKNESDYQAAIGMVKLGNLESAVELFKDMQDYKNSRLFVFCHENGKKVYYENDLPVIEYGSYPQTSDYSWEPLEWYVIETAVNEENPEYSTAVLLSKKIIDYWPFERQDTSFETWETSDVRRNWCNDFYYSGFTEIERNALSYKALSNPNWDNDGTTWDRVYLLSESEVNELPPDILNAQPTNYAFSRGVYGEPDSYAWFLRSPGPVFRDVVYGKRISYANLKGYMYDFYGYYTTTAGIRPAIYLTLYDLQNYSPEPDFLGDSPDYPETNGDEVDGTLETATHFVSAVASSELSDEAGHTYKASNVLSDDGSCWCEGAEGYGEGESIILMLPETQKLYGLIIKNGYAGTEKQYNKNSKVTCVMLDLYNGDTAMGCRLYLDVYDANDRNTYQKFDFTEIFGDAVPATSIKLTIEEVERGYYDDTCLTYIAPLFYD